MPRSPADADWMAAAVALSRRGLPAAAPNPNVGCLIVQRHQIVGRGWTQPGGRPHAEAVALAAAGGDQLVILDEAMTTEPYAFAFAFGSEDLVAEINTILNGLVADGTIASIFEKYDAPYTSPANS